jgi:hyaluronoglucosaminidase
MEFRHRGVAEGFYGPPFAHEDRLWLVERIGRWGMNRYLYAPKDDPLHRASWREPYPAATLREFSELVACGERVGVRVGFALSPGLSIEYSSAPDRAALREKFDAFRALGSSFLALLLDDVPSRLVHDADRRRFASLADAHADLAHALRRALPDALLWVCPTDYLGVEPTDYLEKLGAELDPSIEIGWTGRTVVSPTIPASEAAARAATLRRRLLLWDNVPVADGPMRPMLHLAPYQGRDAALAAHVCGVMLNPMQYARASAVALHTAATFLADPARYDPERAWRAALDEIGAGAPHAFRVFAEAHRYSAQSPDDRDRPLEAELCALRAALAARADPAAALAALGDLLDERARAGGAVRAGLADRRLAAELEPWLSAHSRETRRMQAALEAIRLLLSDAEPSAKTFAVFRFQGRLSREPEILPASFGPRRVLYPQLVSMRDDAMRFGADPALHVDRCLADEFVALADDLTRRLLSLNS